MAFKYNKNVRQKLSVSKRTNQKVIMEKLNDAEL